MDVRERHSALSRTTLAIAAVILLISISALACGKSSTNETTYTVTPAADFTSSVDDVIPAVVVIEVDLGHGSAAAGTGWIVDANGLIVTNNHVVDGARSILVTLNDGRQFTTTTVKASSEHDLAVVKVNAQNLPTASIGDSSTLRMGQPVAAIGNSLDMGLRVTGGLVSRLNVSVTYQTGLTISGCIETDAVINPGNSGGVLIDTSGNVVGITNATLEGQGADAEGFDYAIAINDSMPVITVLISQMA